MLLLQENLRAASGNAQSLTATLDGVTAAVQQTSQHDQSATGTLADVTAAASQGAQHPQTVSATLDSIAVAVTQTSAAQRSQTLTATLADVSAAASQTIQHPQALTGTLADVAASVSQAAQHPQALAATLADVTVSASQSKASQSNDQALTATLDDATAAAAQTSQHTQALALTLDDVTLDGAQIGADPVQAKPAGGWDDEKRKRKRLRYLVEINGKLVDVGSMRNVQEHFAAEAANEPAPKPQGRQRVVADVELIRQAAIEQDLLAEFERRRQAKEYAAMVAAYRAWQDEEDIETLLLCA